MKEGEHSYARKSYFLHLKYSWNRVSWGSFVLLFAESALVPWIYLCLKPSLSSPSQHAAGCLCSQRGIPGLPSVELTLLHETGTEKEKVTPGSTSSGPKGGAMRLILLSLNIETPRGSPGSRRC